MGAVLFAGLAGPISTARGAGIEKDPPSTRVLFEPGAYIEFGTSYVNPYLHGSGGFAQLPTGDFLPIGSTGNLLRDYWSFSGAAKADLGERVSVAVILGEPYAVDTSYPTEPGKFYGGTRAKLDSSEVTAILGYDVVPAVKVFAGARAQWMSASAAIPFIQTPIGGYEIYTDTDTGYGWLVGAAYSKPEIALRVALTYYSQVKHSFDTTEFGVLDGTTDVKTPREVHLEFQSGVAKDTLVFGSVRWVDWSDFSIDPPNYPPPVPLVDYTDDWWTYNLGLGRQLSPSLAGAFQVTWEPGTDSVLTTLGPVDGRTLLTASLAYEVAKFTLTGGVTYGWLGSANNVLGTDFSDGHAVAVGLRVGYHF